MLTESWYARVDVSAWPLRQYEQAGSHENRWLSQPESDNRWLQKDTVIPQSTGVEQGEDWSEVVSSRVATLLGVPHAETALCLRHGRRGSLSRSICPWPLELREGPEVMQRPDVQGYIPHREGAPARDPMRPEVKRPGHHLGNIEQLLRGVQPPAEFDGPPECTAFDVFTGYLLLDALIANRDRHEQNWAILSPRLTSEDERLAPSYDHASSLGFNLDDSVREQKLKERDGVRRWAERGTAWRFEHTGKPPTLTDHAASALAACTSSGAHWWRERLTELNLDDLSEELTDGVIPEMSEPAVRFACEVLAINLRRLRDVTGSG